MTDIVAAVNAADIQAAAICPVCQTRHTLSEMSPTDIRCEDCKSINLLPGQIRIPACVECYRPFNVARASVAINHSEGIACPDCAGRVENRGAMSDALRDMYVMQRGMMYALIRHGWAHHLDDNADEYAAAFTGALDALGLSLSYMPIDREHFPAVAGLTLWGPAACYVLGTDGISDIPEFRSQYSGKPAAETRAIVRDLWDRVVSIATEQAESHDYCGEFESTMDRIYSEMRTPGLSEPEPRESEFTVTVPVTISGYATVTVTARNADDACDIVRDNGVGWDDVDIDRYSCDIEPDWYSVEAESA